MSKKRQITSYRRIALSTRAATTIDKKKRTVEVVAASETPTRMWDYEEGYIDEVLLASGAVLPESGQVPLLDAHSRWSTKDVVGSANNFRADGEELLATMTLSSTAEDVFTKIDEGHITDVSVGYRISAWTTVKKGEKAEIGGRTWEGPVRVVTSWQLRELSVVPIGADEAAKIRSSGGRISIEAKIHENSGEDEMDKRLRAILEERGLPKEASEEQAWAFLEKMRAAEADDKTRDGDGPPSTGVKDDKTTLEAVRAAETKKVREELVIEKGLVARQERQRVTEIIAMGQRSNNDELADKLIAEGKTLAEANAAFRSHWETVAMSVPSVAGRVTVGTEDREKFRKAAVASLLVRGGYEGAQNLPDAQGHDLAALNLRDLAHKTLQYSNQKADQHWAKRALTTSDLTNILRDAMNKFMVMGFDEAEVTWSKWCSVGFVSDFKTIYLPKLSAVAKLTNVNANHGEYGYTSISDGQETTAVLKYGEIIPISEETLENDDMGALSRVPALLGEAANRTVNILVYGDGSEETPGVIVGAAGLGETMADGAVLFSANNANYVASGAGGAPALATLSAGFAAMRTQKDISSNAVLNLTPRFIINPAALEGTVQTVVLSEKVGTQAEPNQMNPYYKVIEIITEPQLDLTGVAGAATRWYLAAAKGKTVTVYFKTGTNGKPQLFQKEGWINDGIEFKVKHIACAKAIDHRGLFSNYGA